MSKTHMTFFFVLAGTLTVSPRLVGQDATSAVRGVVEAHARYAQAGNLAAMDTLWASDPSVHIIEGAGVNHGWEDYRDHHLAPELETFENFQYRFFSIEPQVRGSVAWASFQYEVSADMPRGKLERVGRGTAVLEQRDGRWQIVHLHTSGRAPSPANQPN